MKSIKIVLTTVFFFIGAMSAPYFVLASENSAACQEMIASIQSCDFLSLNFSGAQIYLNRPVTVTGQVNPLAKSATCNTEDANDPWLSINGPDGEIFSQTYQPAANINASFTPTKTGNYNLRFIVDNGTVAIGSGNSVGSTYDYRCEKSFTVCEEGDGGCSSFGGGESRDYAICESNLTTGSTAMASCKSCYGSGGIWTAVGCISQDPRSLVGKLINIGIGLSGGVALVIILVSAFSLTVSQGDVKKTSDAKEWLTAAVIGLIFVILSVSLLEFIGSTVLRIPGFGG